MTYMIQVCINFHRARVLITNARPDEIRRDIWVYLRMSEQKSLNFRPPHPPFQPAVSRMRIQKRLGRYLRVRKQPETNGSSQDLNLVDFGEVDGWVGVPDGAGHLDLLFVQKTTIKRFQDSYLKGQAHNRVMTFLCVPNLIREDDQIRTFMEMQFTTQHILH